VLPAAPRLALRAVDMHVTAFVGVAPRGPARVPLVDETWPDNHPSLEPNRPILRSVAMPVESWDEYRRLYGGFEGSGLLPFAVSTFFQQGGQRAYIVRIVHDYGDARDHAAVASGTFSKVTTAAKSAIALTARDEGSWGNRLSAYLTFQAQPLTISAASMLDVRLPAGSRVPAGALLRLTFADGTRALRFVALAWDRPLAAHPGYERVATFSAAVAAAPVGIDLVEATLDVRDGDPLFPRREVLAHLGLSSDHPRWMATVICNESSLVRAGVSWAGDEVLPPDPTLSGDDALTFGGGEDREADIMPDDFFDPEWVLGNDAPASGVQCLVGIDELSLLVVPDLYSPQPIPSLEKIVDMPSVAGPDFERCTVVAPPPDQAQPVPDLLGLRLDPEQPDDLVKIIGFQRQLADLADLLRSFVVLLDVPPRLGQRRILDWRANFDTSFAAAYHPWLDISPPGDLRTELVEVNPSAVAAGIVARKELAFGVPFGPANELADEVLAMLDRVSPVRHDELHQNAINVFLPERDGIRLTAARTLSSNQSLRQLSVRRLMTMLERVLVEEMQWAVFEPNNSTLRSTLTELLTNFLRQLYEGGAFQGTEDEAFFVRCDDFLNPPYVAEQGQLIVEIGVAPAEPLEFLVLRIIRDGDATLRVESPRG
jgi:Bacteriophage tail sheath protein